MITGGCHCGQVRYEAAGPPRDAGFCYCTDCQKITGSGHACFLDFLSRDVKVTGATRQYGFRHSCPVCASTVFGTWGTDPEHTNIYAGTLDDPELFRPRIAVFSRSRRSWDAHLPGVESFDALP